MTIPEIVIPSYSRYKLRHLSLASRFRLAANYLEGMSYEEIKLIYKVTDDTIYYIVTRMGCPKRPRYFKGKAIENWVKKYSYVKA